MNTQDISGLSAGYVSLIRNLELTRAEEVMLIAMIQARLATPIVAKEAREVSTQVPIISTEKPIPSTPTQHKSIKYDPMYDPPPPMTSDTPPPRATTPGRILTKKSTACICSACRKVVYTTNTDVVDGMRVVDFIAAFTPTEGMKPLDRTTEIENFEGNIGIDCPNCGAFKKLYLTGGPKI